MDLLIIIAIFIFFFIIITIALKNKNDFSDDKDSPVGGYEPVPFYASSNDKAGMKGEELVNNRLRCLLRKDEYLLANVLLPLKNGNKTELDCILLSRKGIFCIETKNWVGHISGNDEDEKWIQRYDDPFMNDKMHHNPVKQNEKHCEVLIKILENEFDVYGMVIFANLEDGSGINSNSTLTLDEFENYFNNCYDDEISYEELRRIYQKLKVYVASEEELKIHREQVRRYFGDK